MSLLRVVVTADWHLDARTGGVERREEIGRAVIEGPVRAAVEGKADLFAFLGDLCDPGERSAVHDVAFPILVARKLSEASIRSAWLPGNHDVVLCDELRTTLDSLAMARIPHVSVYRQSAMALHGPKGCRLLALPYVGASKWGWKPELLVANGPLVVLGHCTSFPGVKGGSEEIEFSRGKGQPWPDEVAKEAVFCANGHFHEPQEILVGGTKVYVPGSLVRLTFGDSDRERGFLVADLEV